MTTSFAATMASKADGELLKVAESPAGTYRAEALQAALDELKRRNLTPRPVEQVQKEREAVDTSNAGVPLEGGWFLGALLMPMFFFPWLMVASNFERKGFVRKARTLRRIVWFELGFIGLMAVIAIVFAKTARH